MYSDKALWKSLLKGDEYAFALLMKLLFKDLFNYGTRFTADSELVKDCVQELFVGIWNRGAYLNTDVNPKPYLLASLRRILHRKLLAEERFVKSRHEELFDHFSLEISVEQQMIDNESAQQLSADIVQMLARLPKRQKEVIYLRYFQNLSREAIADTLEINPQTVSNLLQMALKRLRRDSTIVMFLLLIILAY